ncbi:hypothetical protein A2U01_0032034, partial [Trifolium medium]|nr:hypothetical protein [Trifolium medium]
FDEVTDCQQLLKKIEDTWLGTYKIRANLSKFARGEGPKERLRNETKEQKSEKNLKIDDRMLVAPKNTRNSYREAVAGINTTIAKQSEKTKTFPHTRQMRRLTDEEYRAEIQAIPPDPELYHKLQESFVGTLWELVESEILQVTMKKCRRTKLGGNGGFHKFNLGDQTYYQQAGGFGLGCLVFHYTFGIGKDFKKLSGDLGNCLAWIQKP